MKRFVLVMCLILAVVFGVSCKSSPTTPPVKILPTIVNFTANPTTIQSGGSSTLSWSVNNATTVTIDQGIGTVSATTGTKSVSPTATTTYTLTATNSDGQKTATCVVTYELILPTIDYFLSNPTSIRLNDSSTLTWSVQKATTITIDQGIGTVSATGSRQVTPQVTTTYALTATNRDGQKTANCQVEIKKAAILTISQIPANPTWIYIPATNTTTSNFTAVLTESNNVGGVISDLLVGTFLGDTILSAQDFGGGVFNPLGTLSFSCAVVATGKPDLVIVLAEGTDNNGYTIEEAAYAYLTWPTNIATAQFFKVTERESDPRLIRVIKEIKRYKR